MNRIAAFEKISYEQFRKSCEEAGVMIDDDVLKEIYESIKLPRRATSCSAGYDFFAPFDINLEPGKSILIPTGIRARMDDDWVLMLFPRSGLGFKFRLQLNNTVGIIDSDYYNASNEGHIMCKITNDTNEDRTVFVKKGDGFVQGIFIPYGITIDDDVTDKRTGGFGSTTAR